MTTRKKAVSLFLGLSFFFLATFATGRAVGHEMAHSHPASGRRAAHHSTFLCTWLCGASSFIQTSHPDVNARPLFSPQPPPVIAHDVAHPVFAPILVRSPPSLA